MPELDYALLCDYARAEGGVAHVIAAGIDTIHRPEVPSVANLGLLARIIFADEETGEAHEIEVRLRDQEGEQIAQANLTAVPRRVEGLPEGWPTAALLAMNFGVPLPSFGRRMSSWHRPGRPATVLVSRERCGSTGWRPVVGFCRSV
jgi:uncharacterized protein DUF6941